MDMKLDLWGDISCDNGSALQVLSLLENQAELLSTKTNGIVKVDFSKLLYQYTNEQSAMSSVIDTMAKTLSVMAPLVSAPKIEEVNEHKGLENASALYEQGKYKFELYSSKYKFRLFTMNFKSVFPIKLEIEYGILSDEALTKEINSFEEMKDILSAIFGSNKVRFIIQKMIELDKQ